MLHDRRLGGVRNDLLQTVLCEDNGDAQLPIQLGQHTDKCRCGNGVQLGRGLIQNQHLRIHHHHSGQRQQLFLSAGQRPHIPIEPFLHPEERRRFRHPGTDERLRKAETLRAERQLMPHLVADDLILRGLADKSDPPRLCADVRFGQRPPGKRDLTRLCTMGRQRGFEQPQQGGFPTTGSAEQHQKVPLPHGQIHTVQRLFPTFRIGKAHVPERIAFHAASSFQFSITGMLHRAKYAACSRQFTGENAAIRTLG